MSDSPYDAGKWRWPFPQPKPKGPYEPIGLKRLRPKPIPIRPSSPVREDKQ